MAMPSKQYYYSSTIIIIIICSNNINYREWEMKCQLSVVQLK
jgi:hypothetical protein